MYAREMLDVVRRAGRIAAMAGGVLAIVWVVFGYTQSTEAYCRTCATRGNWSAWGFAIAPNLRLPLVATHDVGAPPPSIGRFLEPGHVHDVPALHSESGLSGPYFLRTTDCRLHLPNPFAFALETSHGLDDFVAAQIAAGKLDVETVRALLAVPNRNIAPWITGPDRVALLRRGCELVGEFSGTPPDRTLAWSINPYDWPPRPCPGRAPDRLPR